MPDVSDKPQMPASEMMFWTKQRRKSRLKPHPALPGCCGVWLNCAMDYTIKNNVWPVRFKDVKGVAHDLVPRFTVTVWVKYVTKMVCLYTHTFARIQHVYIHAIACVYTQCIVYVTYCLYTHTFARIQHVYMHVLSRVHTLCEWASVCVCVRPCVTYTRANGWPGTPLPTATCLNREMPRVTRLRVTVASW